jgi:multisubunit Na+/H+ antiporter MnhC subunit
MKKQQALVMWIIWFACLQSALLLHFIIGGGFPAGANAAEPMAGWLWAVVALPLLMATAVRWLVIPKLQAQKQQLVAMIIGLALSEQPIFFSLFLIGAAYPQNQIAVLFAAVCSLIQFAPSYGTPGYKIEDVAAAQAED